MIFQRGVYGEILPLWLMPNRSSNSTFEPIVRDEIFSATKPDVYNISEDKTAFTRYQQELAQVLSGKRIDDPAAIALYRAVVQGQPIGLYPNGPNDEKAGAFVPILYRLGDDQWQLGIPGEGRHAILLGCVELVLQQVWQLYIDWEKAEQTDGEYGVMKAVVMAGGVGSRLQPLTSGCPKPMVHFVNESVAFAKRFAMRIISGRKWKGTSPDIRRPSSATGCVRVVPGNTSESF